MYNDVELPNYIFTYAYACIDTDNRSNVTDYRWTLHQESTIHP